MNVVESNKLHEKLLNYHYIDTIDESLIKIGYDIKKLYELGKYENLFHFLWNKYELRHTINKDSQHEYCYWVTVYERGGMIYHDWRFQDYRYCENLALYQMLKHSKAID